MGIIAVGMASALVALICIHAAHAANTVPTTMNFQGRLTDSSGVPVANGSYNVKFTIYNASSTAVWTKTRVSLALAYSRTGIKNDQYQMVKLTTGEIFFGKLQNTTGDYLTLENAYFIQDSQNAQDTTILSRKSTVAKSESPMRIKADKVVYWENLAKDSKVAETIKNAAGN